MILNSLQRANFSRLIKAKAVKLGFYQCGISKATYLEEDSRRMEDWLDKGYHGEMLWLERNKAKRYDPSKLVEGALSVVTVLYNYTPGETLSNDDGYRISNYAYGTDYHKVVKDRLYLLLDYIEELSGKRTARVFVDSAPVMDRAWAQRSGLGFIGKNTLLINRKGGSYFFIGHVILDLELAYESGEPEKNFCGSCTLCLKSCPTGALEPFVLDANKCISYLTIEHRSDIPEKYKDDFGRWIFGCDICQEVCPWNRDAKPNNDPHFEIPERLKNMSVRDWQALDEQQFDEMFRHSAIMRTGFKGLKRNINYLED